MDLLLCFLFPSSHAGEVRINDTGLVTGILLTFRRLGGLLELSICSTTFSSYFSSSLDTVSSLLISLEHLRDPGAYVASIRQPRALVMPDTTSSLLSMPIWSVIEHLCTQWLVSQAWVFCCLSLFASRP
jgi:hypothetical protein